MKKYGYTLPNMASPVGYSYCVIPTTPISTFKPFKPTYINIVYSGHMLYACNTQARSKYDSGYEGPTPCQQFSGHEYD